MKEHLKHYLKQDGEIMDTDPTRGMLHPDIENMTEARKSKERLFHERTGGCWHEPIYEGSRICDKCGVLIAEGNPDEPYDMSNANPTYSHSDDILKRMKDFLGGEKWLEFTCRTEGMFPCLDGHTLISVDYIFNSQALLDKCLEYLEGK